MLFRVIAAVASVSFIAQGALAVLTPDQVVTNLNFVTTIYKQANDAVSSISASSTPSQIASAATTVASNLNIATSKLGADVSVMLITTPFVCDVTPSISSPFAEFVRIDQALLAVLVGKQNYFVNFGVAQPILPALKALKGVIDPFASAMINLNPCTAGSMADAKDQLDESVQNAILSYEALCPFGFPLPPICIP
ncbi:hypothetical protein V8E53_013200 [Lactarius tabidus]